MAITKDLRADPQQLLRHQLEEFVREARENERKLRRFQALELRLIGINSLCELLETLLYPDYSTFKWDWVTLILLDPQYEIQRILGKDNRKLLDHPSLMFATEADALERLYPRSLFPLLGPYKPRHHAPLFPVRAARGRRPASVALLPLVRHGRLIGSLNLGSRNANRFVRGVRTDFFEHLAAVTAICLENAVNHERLKHQGLTDTLTGVNNRRFFDQRLAEEMAAAHRDRHPLSCLLLDVDHFKQVNDRYGHQVGDRVLMEVAHQIRAQLRGHDVLARYGGEEFAALLAQVQPGRVREVAERIRAAVAARQFHDAGGHPFQVTLSIGIATYDPNACNSTGAAPPAPGDPVQRPAAPSGERLVALADAALYTAKATGRNRVEYAGLLTAG